MSVRRDNRFPWLAFALFAAIVTCLVCAAGCGGWVSQARHGLEATAVMVDGVDRGVAKSALELCTAHRGDSAAIATCLHEHHLDGARTAIHSADAALRSAQAELDAAERAKDEHRWQAAAPCLAKGVTEAFASVEAAGVHVPPAVDQVLVFLGLAGQCGGAP